MLTVFLPLQKADGRAGEVEGFTKPVFQETLEAEMQRLLLVCEKNECGRLRRSLRDVENLDHACRR